MAKPRGVLRVLGVLGWTKLVFGVWLISRLVGFGFRGFAQRSHSRLTRAWARGFARILGMRVQRVGTPPSSPFFLVCNHLSYMDIITLWTEVDGVYLAKSEISGWPVVGALARSVGTLFIDRSKMGDLPRAIEQVEATIASQRGVIIFPEGGNQRGDRVYPFKPSVFEVPLRAGHPVRCAALSYRTPPGSTPADRAVCWWSAQSLLSHFLDLASLPWFEARLEFIADPVTAADRKALSRSAQEVVEAHFVPSNESGSNPGHESSAV